MNKTELYKAKSARKDELKALRARAGGLSSSEYRAILEEIQKNYVVELGFLALDGIVKGTGALIALVEKVHWMLDSMGQAPVADRGPTIVNVHFMRAAPDDKVVTDDDRRESPE